MKRSEVNSALVWAKNLLTENNIRLPRTAYWTMDEWKTHADRLDVIQYTSKAGEPIDVHPGDSISLEPYVAHIFGPKPGCGELIVGEVSKVNDDTTDNYFLKPTSRFADIEEDEAPLHPLCNEYDKL